MIDRGFFCEKEFIIFTFDELEVSTELKQAIVEMGFTEPTPIQAEIIPHVLAGKDCLALAPTGSGKTCAFGVPVAHMINPLDGRTQALVLCPTRELAMQTELEFKKLLKHLDGVHVIALYGGQNLQRQLHGLRRQPQIVVGTPGRLMDHLRRKTLSLSALKTMVLDEADEMLDMGFRDDITKILKDAPNGIQTIMFSATMSKDIKAVSQHYQTDPVTVHINSEEDKPVIAQFFTLLKETTKVAALKKIIAENGYQNVLVFCNTKRKVDEVHTKMLHDGLHAAALHGDMFQRQRDAVMRDYRAHAIDILIATDVAARGIDVKNIEAVFNYDMPNNDEYYIHRIGRTARAKAKGAAYTFVTKADIHRVREIEKFAGVELVELSLSGVSESLAVQKAEGEYARIFVNVGTKDGLSEISLREFIQEKTEVPSSSISEIHLMDTFSFVEVNANCTAKMLTLNGAKLKKRTVVAEISVSRQSNGGRRGGGNYDSRNSNDTRSRGGSYDSRNRDDSRNRGGSSDSRNRDDSRNRSGSNAPRDGGNAPRDGGGYDARNRDGGAGKSNPRYARPEKEFLGDRPKKDRGADGGADNTPAGAPPKKRVQSFGARRSRPFSVPKK